jgi:hypothetical protein
VTARLIFVPSGLAGSSGTATVWHTTPVGGPAGQTAATGLAAGATAVVVVAATLVVVEATVVTAAVVGANVFAVVAGAVDANVVDAVELADGAVVAFDDEQAPASRSAPDAKIRRRSRLFTGSLSYPESGSGVDSRLATLSTVHAESGIRIGGFPNV